MSWGPVRRWWPWVAVVGAMATGAGIYIASGDPRAIAVGTAAAAATGYVVYRKLETDKLEAERKN